LLSDIIVQLIDDIEGKFKTLNMKTIVTMILQRVTELDERHKKQQIEKTLLLKRNTVINLTVPEMQKLREDSLILQKEIMLTFNEGQFLNRLVDQLIAENHMAKQSYNNLTGLSNSPIIESSGHD
jgi:hypothetical protein